MKIIYAGAAAALLLAAVQPAQAASKCDDDLKDFWVRAMQNGEVTKMSGDKIAEVTRRATRAYDACQAGDSFTLHGIWDQVASGQQERRQ